MTSKCCLKKWLSTCSGHIGKHTTATCKLKLKCTPKGMGQAKAFKRHPGAVLKESTNVSSWKLPDETLPEGKLAHLSLELNSQYLLVSCYQKKRKVIHSLSQWQPFLTTGSEQWFSEDQNWQAPSHLWVQVPGTEWRLTDKLAINKSGGWNQEGSHWIVAEFSAKHGPHCTSSTGLI